MKPKDLKISCLLVTALLVFQVSEAQIISRPQSPLKKILLTAEVLYPSLRAKQFQLLASEKQVSLARNSLMPSLDAAVQTNLATHNNISGMVYQQYMLPISGPAASDNSSRAVWGNATSLLLNWQPFTFGQRQALINESKSVVGAQKVELDNALFRYKIQVAQLYMEWLMATEAEKVLLKNVDRARHNAIQSRTLAEAGIRPGSDSALFISELSNAKVQLLQVQRLKKDQAIRLETMLDTTLPNTMYDSSFFKIRPRYSQSTGTSSNSSILVSQSLVDLASARKKSIQRSWYPRLTLWGTTFARGSDINYDGTVTSQGFSFSRYNYGLGVQLAVPLLKFTDARLQLKQQELILMANEQALAQTKLEVNQDLLLAENAFQTAVQITEETTLQYQSAQFAYDAVASRYNSGMIDFTTLLQAQYNLVKAEMELKKSYIEMWRSLLNKAATEGDLSIFINELN